MSYEIKHTKIDELIKMLVTPWELPLNQHPFNTSKQLNTSISDVQMWEFFDESQLNEDEKKFLFRHRT